MTIGLDTHRNPDLETACLLHAESGIGSSKVRVYEWRARCENRNRYAIGNLFTLCCTSPFKEMFVSYRRRHRGHCCDMSISQSIVELPLYVFCFSLKFYEDYYQYIRSRQDALAPYVHSSGLLVCRHDLVILLFNLFVVLYGWLSLQVGCSIDLKLYVVNIASSLIAVRFYNFMEWHICYKTKFVYMLHRIGYRTRRLNRADIFFRLQKTIWTGCRILESN